LRRRLVRRARLACVDRACQEFCASHINCTRRRTTVVVPFKGWETYVRGVGGLLAWHNITLQNAYVQFQVCSSNFLRKRAA